MITINNMNTRLTYRYEQIVPVLPMCFSTSTRNPINAPSLTEKIGSLRGVKVIKYGNYNNSNISLNDITA